MAQYRAYHGIQYDHNERVTLITLRRRQRRRRRRRRAGGVVEARATEVRHDCQPASPRHCHDVACRQWRTSEATPPPQLTPALRTYIQRSVNHFALFVEGLSLKLLGDL